MRLIICGDFYISREYKNRELIDSSVVDLFSSADYRIFNLEAPVTSCKKKDAIPKTGPHLNMEEDTIRPFLQQLNINMVTLGNNHIMDYGEAGFAHTVSFLNEHKISYVSGGINLIEAKKPRILDINGLSIGILNFAENEWSIAGENRAGANPLDIVDNVSQIKSLKMMCDKVICIIHGGHEMYSLPSPRMVKQYHFYADSGADVIIGHHTHCILPYEVYRSVPIIYGLGNFSFTIPSQYSDWYTGGVLELEIKDSKPIEFKLFFVKQDDMSFSAHLMGGLQKRELEQ